MERTALAGEVELVVPALMIASAGVVAAMPAGADSCKCGSLYAVTWSRPSEAARIT
jgi:hypothetical protein